MAKGAKRKTKWVSLSLANANTKTSNATGSDSEQALPHQPQNYGEGHRNKMLNGSSLASKPSKDLIARTDAPDEHDGNERTQDHTGSGNRTDTSTGSDCVAGSERRPANNYHRRRPPPYNTRTNWSGGSSNGRNHYHRNGYYGNGGNGHYGAGKRSHYDNYTRRQQPTATATNRTTSGDGAETGGTTINDDEYTRITTPRQDVLFKKGYLSRPKPSVTTASTSNTGSSSIAGTTSEGSDGGNGGSNSISTTESITSEYGGSYAADGSQLFDYSIPCIPCGYFTEKGVLVMNGFAVDNNGFSYFNGGQTYIYPPNYNGCQQSPLATANTGDQTTDSMLYANGDTNDETNANESTELDRSTPNHSTTAIDTEPMLGYGEAISAVSCSGVYNENVATGGDGQYFTNDGLSTMESVPLCEVVPESTMPNGDQLSMEEPADTSTVCDEANAVASTCVVQEVQDFSENGYFQYTNGYDFAQFYNSMCYPNLLMEQYRLYDDGGLPLYCGSEYAMTNEEVYGHQSSFKKRKKRFRTFEEMPSTNGNSYDVGNTPSTMAVESNSTGDATDFVPENYVPSSEVCHQSYQLNAEVQEFLPSVPTTDVPHAGVVKSGDVCATGNRTTNGNKSNTRVVVKTRHPVAPKLPKASSQKIASCSVAHTADDAAVSPVSANGKTPPNKANRKKDLIESTLAFAAQNIDLTRPKAAASQAPSHDSELLWTTIDRNGRKKRVAMVPEQDTITANGAEKESSVEERTKENLTVGETMQSETSNQAKDDVTVSVESQLPVANGASDGNGKKEQQTKMKKKTQKHKRQQLRKSVGNFNKQPLEGFQLIEPEFTSSAVGHRRGKNSDKAGRVDTTAQTEATQIVKGTSKKQPSSTASQKQSGTIDGHCRVIEEQPEIMEVKLNCDNSSNGTSSEVSLSEEDAQFEVEELVAQKEVPLLALASTLDDESNVNETETEKHHQQLMSVDVAEAQKEEHETEELQQAVVEDEELRKDITQVVQNGEFMEEPDPEKTVQSTKDPTELDVSLISHCVEEKNTSGQDETHQVLSSAIEEQQITNVQLSVDTNVITSATKQLTISPTLSAQKEDEAEHHADDAADNSITSEGDDTRMKRDSMSGVGYTESIDSGLQSPALCGGIASPDTSSMMSSIESQPAIDLPGVASSQSALSQMVGTWLMRKLEVHEPEEVFVLPSNPLLIQRLERFHQLQRREHHERLRGPLASESEAEEQEYDLEDDDDDTDSDYMSDGQGKIDRTQSDDVNSSNPESPLNSIQQKVVDVVQTNPLDDTPAGSLMDSKRHATHQTDGGRNYSEPAVRRAADSKRCLIM